MSQSTCATSTGWKGKVIVEEALKGYITIVQGKIPHAKVFQGGSFKKLTGGKVAICGTRWETTLGLSTERGRVGAEVPARVDHRGIEFFQLHVVK